MKTQIFSSTGDKLKELELPSEIFEVKTKDSVVHQVFVAETANRRLPWADTKDRSEVRGGGKKPWKQKGTGRARHGSIRSPIWKGGGVTFGPLSTRNYKQKVNRGVARLALSMTLSAKAATGDLIVVESLPTTGKSKDLSNLKSKLGLGRRSVIFLVGQEDAVLVRAAKNISRLALCRASAVSLCDVLNHSVVVVDLSAIEALKARLQSK